MKSAERLLSTRFVRKYSYIEETNQKIEKQIEVLEGLINLLTEFSGMPALLLFQIVLNL